MLLVSWSTFCGAKCAERVDSQNLKLRRRVGWRILDERVLCFVKNPWDQDFMWKWHLSTELYRQMSLEDISGKNLSSICPSGTNGGQKDKCGTSENLQMRWSISCELSFFLANVLALENLMWTNVLHLSPICPPFVPRLSQGQIRYKSGTKGQLRYKILARPVLECHFTLNQIWAAMGYLGV